MNILTGKKICQRRTVGYNWCVAPLTPILPDKNLLGPLKDMATEVVSASAGLEKSIALTTARTLGEFSALSLSPPL